MSPPPVASAEKQSFKLAAEARLVADARERAVSIAEPFVAEHRIPSLRLVMSEVLTNAVRHGAPGGEMTVAVTPKPEFLCVQVTDEGDGFAPRPRASAPDADGGFGLFLIERLTRRWGLTRERGTTRVWFEFDLDAGAPGVQSL